MDWIREREGKIYHVFLRNVPVYGLEEYERETHLLTIDEQNVVLERLNALKKAAPYIVNAITRLEPGSLKQFEVQPWNGLE